MNDWTSGYVADVSYTFGYYQELNPLRVKLAFLRAGLMAPEVGAACELGFGQGLSVNVHAAASVVQWSGTDFNPSQAAFAQELSASCGSQAQLYDQAFAEFAARTDLPDFDYIGLHGIFSWISDENRAVLVDLIRRKLKVGGVLYISYNTQPGWAAFAPMRHLITEHAGTMGAYGAGMVSRVNGALDFGEKLLALQPNYVRANPGVAERFKSVKGQNRAYLAHEYFNRDWQPMHFSTMAQWLEPTKLSYACSAHYLDHVDAINLSTEQQAFLMSLPDDMFRETVRDFMVNQQFRRDYWVKGPRKLSVAERADGLRALRLLLVTHRPDVVAKVTGALGEAGLQEHMYGPVLDLMADHQPRTLGDMERALQGKGLGFAQLLEVVTVLMGAGHLAPVQEDAQVRVAKQRTERLNAHLIQKARYSGDITYLASPVTGGGVTVSRFAQLFLLALSQGQQQPAEWAQSVWDTLQSQGQRLNMNGAMLESAEDNLKELTQQAQAFAQKQLPVLRALQVV